MITKTSLQSHQSVKGASFLAKCHARAAKTDLATGHLCLLAGCAGLLGLCPRWRQRAQVIEACLVGKRISYLDARSNRVTNHRARHRERDHVGLASLGQDLDDNPRFLGECARRFEHHGSKDFITEAANNIRVLVKL